MIEILLHVLIFVALACVIQLLLLTLTGSKGCPRLVKVILPWILLLPAAGVLVLIPCCLLSKPSGFLDLRGVAAFLCLIAALLVLAGWGLGFGVRALYRRKKGGAS